MNQNTVSGNLDRIKRATDDMRLITGTTGEDIETVAQAVSDLNDDNIAKDETIAELEQEIEDLQPSGTINVNNNGITNVAGYQYVDVNVPSQGGLYPIDLSDKILDSVSGPTISNYVLIGPDTIDASYCSDAYEWEVQEKQYRVFSFYDNSGDLLGFHTFIMPWDGGQQYTYTTTFPIPDALRTEYIAEDYVYNEYEDWSQPEPRVKMHIYNDDPSSFQVDENLCTIGTVFYRYELPKEKYSDSCYLIFDGDIICLNPYNPLYIYGIFKTGQGVLLYDSKTAVSGKIHITKGIRCPAQNGEDFNTLIGIYIGGAPYPDFNEGIEITNNTDIEDIIVGVSPDKDKMTVVYTVPPHFLLSNRWLVTVYDTNGNIIQEFRHYDGWDNDYNEVKGDEIELADRGFTFGDVSAISFNMEGGNE